VIANFPGAELVVARDDLDRNAAALKGLDGRSGRLLRWVEESDVALEDEIALVGLAVERSAASSRHARFTVLGGERQYAEALGAQAFVLLLQRLDVRTVHRADLAVERSEEHTSELQSL